MCIFQIILKEREQRKQQHLLEQTAVPKDEDNVCQSGENITEDKLLLQDSQAGIFQEKAIMQYVDGDLRLSTLSTFKNMY